MKKLFLSMALMIAITTNAQIKYYKDSTFTEAYTLLSNPTSVTNGLFWDDNDFSVPIGFNFKFFNQGTDTLYHSGSTYSSGGMFNFKPVNMSTQFISFLSMLASDIRDRDTTNSGSGISPISYKTTGASPNRIFKLQFQNAGFGNAMSNGNFDDSLSMQVWLYETSNMIDIRFGPSNLVSSDMDLWDGGPGPFIGVFDSVDFQSPLIPIKKSYFLNGPIATPFMDSSLTSFGTITNIPGLTGKPTSGRVYRIMPVTKPVIPAGMQEVVSDEDLTMYYNPGYQQLKIINDLDDKGGIQLIDMNGRIILKQAIEQATTRINLNQLTHGVYIVHWSNGKQMKVLKFVI